jgi:hypothetical protein
MLRTPSSRLFLATLLAALVLPATAIAQSQSDQSVADAARRAREQKKTQPKPVKVVTEDDIPARIPASAVQPAAQPGQAATPAPDGSTPAQPAAPAGKPAVPKDAAAKAAQDAEIAALKESIAKAQEDVDVFTRSLALGQDSFLSNPDYAHDTAGKAKLDNLKQQISDKQDALAQLKTKLAALTPPAPAVPDSTAPPSVPSAPNPN